MHPCNVSKYRGDNDTESHNGGDVQTNFGPKLMSFTFKYVFLTTMSWLNVLLTCSNMHIHRLVDSFLLGLSQDSSWDRFKRENGMNRICLTPAYDIIK